MKAIGIEEYGGVDKLIEKQVPKPKPGPRDLLVKIYATATNPIDFKVRCNVGLPDDQEWLSAINWNWKEHQVFKKKGEFRILGWDASGVVEEIGSEVKNFKPGDEVYFAGDIFRQGSYAEYTLVDERIVEKKPSNLSHVEAAAIPLTGLTAYEGLMESLGIPAFPEKENPKSILVFGGAGGVGSIVIQLAKKVCKLKHIIATASRPESQEICKKMGATHTINYKEDLVKQLKDIGFEDGVDYIYDAADPSKLLEFEKCLKPLGKICEIVPTLDKLNVSFYMWKRISLVHELMFTRPGTNTEPEKQGEILNILSKLAEEGQLDPRVSKVYNFTVEQLREAHKQQESGKTTGKLVIKVRE